MKTKKLLLFFLMIAGLVACQEDEDIEPENGNEPGNEVEINPASLVGTWQGREAVIDIQSSELNAPEHFVNTQFNALVEFYSDSTVTLKDDNIQSAGDWQFMNDARDIMVSIDRFGNEYLDRTETYKITHLSDSRLTLDLEKQDSIAYPTPDKKIFATVRVTFHYDKTGGASGNQ